MSISGAAPALAVALLAAGGCGDGGKAAVIACQERLVGLASASQPLSLDGCSDAQRSQYAGLVRALAAATRRIEPGDQRSAMEMMASMEELQQRRQVLRQELERMRQGE